MQEYLSSFSSSKHAYDRTKANSMITTGALESTGNPFFPEFNTGISEYGHDLFVSKRRCGMMCR